MIFLVIYGTRHWLSISSLFAKTIKVINVIFLTLGFQDQIFDFYYKNIIIRNSAEKKILRITIDHKLNFKSRIINISTVANQNLSALCRISNYIASEKCKLLVNAFVESQFSYCPLIRIFCTRESINRGHKIALRIISEDCISSFIDLVTLLKENTIYQRAINFLMTEIFK